MILAAALPVVERSSPTPVTIRLIGILDRALLESFADAFAGLTAPGSRTLIVLVRDLIVMHEDNLNRFLATLERFRAAGNDVCIETTPAWRRILRAIGWIRESLRFARLTTRKPSRISADPSRRIQPR